MLTLSLAAPSAPDTILLVRPIRSGAWGSEMSDVPWYIVALLATLVLFYVGFVTCLAETRAVQGKRLWPFRSGIVAVRFRADDVALFDPGRPGRAGLAGGIEYRVISPTECVFVEEGWRSVLSWTRTGSPFRLKGYAMWHPSGVEVIGRISLGACIALPAVSLWLSGCGLLGMSQSPWFFSIFVVVGLGLPILGTWHSLPREIAAFRAAWVAVSEELRS